MHRRKGPETGDVTSFASRCTGPARPTPTRRHVPVRAKGRGKKWSQKNAKIAKNFFCCQRIIDVKFFAPA